MPVQATPGLVSAPRLRGWVAKLDSSAEADVVGDDRGGTDGKWFRIGDV